MQSGTPELSADDHGAIAGLDRLAADLGLGDLSPDLKDAAAYLTERIRRQFEEAGSLFDPLAPGTILARERRERRGETLVASLQSPLRAFHDSLLKAAIDLTGDVPGSAYHKERDALTFGIDPDGLAWARRALLGGPHSPARDAAELPGSALDAAQRLVDAAIAKRLRAALLGGSGGGGD